MQWRMADRAAGARFRGRQGERFRHARRTGIDQNCIGSGVKILLHPGEILAAFFAGSAVATGRFATGRSDKLVSPKRGGDHFPGRASGQIDGDRGERMPLVKFAIAHAPDVSGERQSNARQ